MRKSATDLPSNRLRELRERANLKPYDIAARFRVDQSTVYRWENGPGSVPDEIKFALAQLYNVTITYLMGWDEIEQGAAA